MCSLQCFMIYRTCLQFYSQGHLFYSILGKDSDTFTSKVSWECEDCNVRQINVLYRFRNVFNIEESKVIHNTFILANFNYCPIVWHFCDKASIRKMEKTLERAFQFLLNDKKCSYSSLLEKRRQTTLHLKNIKRIACEV